MAEINPPMRKICHKCGRKNSKDAIMCYTCEFDISRHEITHIDSYYCFSCDEKPQLRDDEKNSNNPNWNNYFYPIARNNETIKICNKCCSQNYSNNNNCLRCNNYIRDTVPINSAKCYNAIEGYTNMYPGRICFNCNIFCSKVTNNCKTGEKCSHGDIIYSPIIPYCDYRMFILKTPGSSTCSSASLPSDQQSGKGYANKKSTTTRTTDVLSKKKSPASIRKKSPASRKKSPTSPRKKSPTSRKKSPKSSRKKSAPQ